MKYVIIAVLVGLCSPFVIHADEEKKVKTFEVAGLTFQKPDAWAQAKPSSSMRKAQLSIPNKDGDKGEVVFFFFGKGGGGSVKANVDRWLKQFKKINSQKTETSEVKASKAKITTVTADGTFMSGPPFGEKVEKTGYGMRAAILEYDGGPVFIKATGPKKLIDAALADFDKMVNSAFAKGSEEKKSASIGPDGDTAKGKFNFNIGYKF